MEKYSRENSIKELEKSVGTRIKGRPDHGG
jgi:hypothetical protein